MIYVKDQAAELAELDMLRARVAYYAKLLDEMHEAHEQLRERMRELERRLDLLSPRER